MAIPNQTNVKMFTAISLQILYVEKKYISSD